MTGLTDHQIQLILNVLGPDRARQVLDTSHGPLATMLATLEHEQAKPSPIFGAIARERNNTERRLSDYRIGSTPWNWTPSR